MNEKKSQGLADVERIAHEVAASLGVEIVEFVFHSRGKHSLLRIDIDRPGMPGVALADCESMSRSLGDRIEDIAFFEDSYDLQVSSPGLDRPIKTDADLRRNVGRPIRVEFRDESDKVREIHGTLLDTPEKNDVRIATPQGETSIARERIVLMKQDVVPGGRKRKGP